MKQIVVISDNQVGIIADISKVLSKAGINIEKFNASAVEVFGAVILTTDNYDKALQILNEASFTAISEDAFVIQLENKPGSLAKISVRFKDANINIRSMHIIKRTEKYALVALATEKTKKARELLKDVLIA